MLKRSLLALGMFGLLAAGAQAENPRWMVGEVKGYTAKAGENLLDIALRNSLAIDHLCFANGWPASATKIYPGTPVVLPKARVLPSNPPRDGLVINLPERGLYFFRNGHFKQFYPISIGLADDFPTPTRYVTIVEKVVNPTWYPPQGSKWARGKKPIGPGPENPLGDRWIGLSGGYYGIHGNNKDWNIGLSTTHGCMRMYNTAIRSLFEQVRVGMPVRIEYETAKVGRFSDGSLYLVTFPDIYKRSDPVKAAQNALKRIGVSGAWSPALESEAAKCLGLPISLETAQAMRPPGLPQPAAVEPEPAPVEAAPAPEPVPASEPATTEPAPSP